MSKTKKSARKRSAANSTALPPGQQIPKGKPKPNKQKQQKQTPPQPKKSKKQRMPNEPPLPQNVAPTSLPQPVHQLPNRPQTRIPPQYQPQRPQARPQSPHRLTEPSRGPRGGAPPQPYQFGSTDSYRPDHHRSSNDYSLPDRRPDERMQFTMNVNQQGPIPSGPRFPVNAAHSNNDSHRRRDNPRARGNDRSNGHRPPRRAWGGPPPAHDRAILRALNRPRETTPERLSGMTGGSFRFKAQDELSESMSESDSDTALGVSNKRQKISQSAESDRPKWCNPDPYSALPPTYEPGPKKKDVVQLIRKAKEVVQSQELAKNSLADNEDFVSLAFSDDEEDEVVLPRVDARSVTSLPGPKVVPQNFNAFEALEPSVPMLPPAPELHQPTLSKKRKLTKLGEIVTEWAAFGGNATPWKQPGYAATSGMTWRLHQEILDFHAWVRPMAFEKRIRDHLIKRIEDEVCIGEYSHCSIRAFGSFPSELYLPTSDMDLVLVSRNYELYGKPSLFVASKSMHTLLNKLQRKGIARYGAGATVVSKAKVPIIKFLDDRTGLHVDISFENLTGVTANSTYLSWKAQYPDLVFLVCIIKQFLLMRNLNEVFNGGLGGFAITCLVVSFLHLEANPGENVPPRNLGELLIDFFEFYGRKFNMTTTQICMNPPQYWTKSMKYTKRNTPIIVQKWSILDPNNHDNDISAGTTAAPLIAQCFAQAADDLRRSMSMIHASPAEFAERQSILGCIIGGNYSSHTSQRAVMDQLDKYYMSLRRD